MTIHCTLYSRPGSIFYCEPPNILPFSTSWHCPFNCFSWSWQMGCYLGSNLFESRTSNFLNVNVYLCFYFLSMSLFLLFLFLFLFFGHVLLFSFCICVCASISFVYVSFSIFLCLYFFFLFVCCHFFASCFFFQFFPHL